jgi:hypothetical protein
VTALVVGCARSPETPKQSAADLEGEVRGKFAALQAAVKVGDVDGLWALLDGKSQAEAERASQALQAAYGKAGPEEKAKQAEALGLTATDLAGLTGKAILKTERFRKRYRELPESAVEKVVVEGDHATVHFLEPDGDHEKLVMVRQQGQWKVWLKVPRLTPQ